MIGLFLPYSPLHHLLLADAGRPLVMTSGNLSDEPIAYRNDEAIRRLGGIADLFLLHDRDIDTRCDDSVVDGHRRPRRRCCGARAATCRGAIQLARGFGPPVLACGALLKNTFCLGVGNERVARSAHRRSREPRDLRLVHAAPSRAWSASCESGRRSSRTICIPTTCRRATRAARRARSRSPCSTITRTS